MTGAGLTVAVTGRPAPVVGGVRRCCRRTDILLGICPAFQGSIAGYVYPGIKQQWRELLILSSHLQLEADGNGKRRTLGRCWGRGHAIWAQKLHAAGLWRGITRSATEGMVVEEPVRQRAWSIPHILYIQV
jgi:hypothetical protein